MESVKASNATGVAASPGAVACAVATCSGIPMAMTDYAGAMDVMDEMVEQP